MTSERPADPVGDGNGDGLYRGYSAALQPLVRVGVTGHRDLADPQEGCRLATEALCRVLNVLETAAWPVGMSRSTTPSATTLGYRLVSPLAEGGDRVVAGLVLSPDARLSSRPRELVVPLPFQLDYYRGHGGQPGSDCSTPQSQAEFDRLRSAALWTRPLHLRVPASQPQRDAWYRDVGKYVVDHCDLLFALWDGRDSGQQSGTSAVVRYALQRGIPVVWIPVARQAPAEPATAALDHSAVPRLLTGSVTRADELRSAIDLSSPEAHAALVGRHRDRRPAQEFLLERLARLEELCRYARSSRHIQRDITAEMLTARASGHADHDVVHTVAGWIIPAYVTADGLAKRYQLKLKSLNIGVYGAAAAAVALGAFAAIMFPYGGSWRLLVVFEALVLVTLLVVQWQDLRKKCRDRWVAYRAVGEYFRIGRFLSLATPQAASGLEFDRFARLYSWSSEPSSVPWFAPVIGWVWDSRPHLDLHDANVPWLRDYLIADWFNGQISYYEGRRNYHQRWDKRLQRIIGVTLFSTILVVLLHVLMDYFPLFLGIHHHSRDLLLKCLSVAAITLTSVAAAFSGYAGQQRHNYHYMRFHRMTEELRGIKASISTATTMDQLRMHIGEVRRVTLGEATNWYEGMQEQVIDSPS
jgi:hypothetical protein